jgi:hypothetical protein
MLDLGIIVSRLIAAPVVGHRDIIFAVDKAKSRDDFNAKRGKRN